jgi:Family of unknown function (DUF5317)
VALGSLAVQLILYNHPTDHQAWAIAWGPLIWTACLAALCAMLVRNACASRLTRYAWALAALGVGLNVLVVISNGGYMPQSDDARIAVRGGSLAVGEPSQPQLLNVVQMNADTRLSLLGDVIPEPAVPQVQRYQHRRPDAGFGSGLVGVPHHRIDCSETCSPGS